MRNKEWIEIDKCMHDIIYSGISTRQYGKMEVFESYTENKEKEGKLLLKNQLTVWGLSETSTPVIKNVLNNFTDWNFYVHNSFFLEN